jgi:hypothetical protein
MAAKAIDVLLLLECAEEQLNKQDFAFDEAVEVVLGILRCKGILSHKRISLNGEWHRRLAAMLVLAHEQKTSFALPTRMQGELHLRGCSTTIVAFLDKAVKEGVIYSNSPDAKAKGPLSVGNLIGSYLQKLENTGVQIQGTQEIIA